MKRLYEHLISEHFREERLALQVGLDLPFIDRNCFDLPRPTIVPARTLLSQLV